jgi:hypothetical protein
VIHIATGAQPDRASGAMLFKPKSLPRVWQMSQPSYLTNFKTLIEAFRANDVNLVQCIDSNGETCALICAVNKLPDGSSELVPFATMLPEPLDPLVIPPSSGGPSSPFSVN